MQNNGAKGSAPPARAFETLMGCSCWPEAEKLLTEGLSTTQVVDFIQSRGDMVHVKRDSLARTLRRWKSRFLGPRREPTLMERLVPEEALEFDDVNELTRVILIQRQRVEKDLELEHKMPKSMGSLTKEIQFLADLIERRARILMDMGKLSKAPQRHEVVTVGDQTIAKLYADMPQETREALRAAIARDYGEEQHHAIEAPYRVTEENV